MRSLFLLLAACLAIAGAAATDIPGTDSTNIEFRSAACTDIPYAGLPGGTVIAVVEVSGHGNTTIDGNVVTPAGSGMYQGYGTVYYTTTAGAHTVVITSPGYFMYTNSIAVCDGKVSYVYYNLASHLRPGMTGLPATMTAAAETTAAETATVTGPASSQYPGQPADLKAALGTSRTPSAGPSGSIVVATDPPGASVYIDGVLLGVTPATIPGLSAGSHTMILKLDGYDDLTLPVTITAGNTQYYSSAMRKGGAGATAAAAPTTKKSPAPGCGTVIAAGAAVLLLIRGKNAS